MPDKTMHTFRSFSETIAVNLSQLLLYVFHFPKLNCVLRRLCLFTHVVFMIHLLLSCLLSCIISMAYRYLLSLFLHNGNHSPFVHLQPGSCRATRLQNPGSFPATVLTPWKAWFLGAALRNPQNRAHHHPWQGTQQKLNPHRLAAGVLWCRNVTWATGSLIISTSVSVTD